MLVSPILLVLGMRVRDSVLSVVSRLGVTTVRARSVSPSCSICWLGPRRGGGLWLGIPSPGKGFSYPLSSWPCGVFLAGSHLAQAQIPSVATFPPQKGSFPEEGAMGPCRQWCHPGGDSPAAAAPAHPEHPFTPRVACSQRVERLLTSHGTELFPRTAALCFPIFEILSWVRISLPACPLCVTSA